MVTLSVTTPQRERRVTLTNSKLGEHVVEGFECNRFDETVPKGNQSKGDEEGSVSFGSQSLQGLKRALAKQYESKDLLSIHTSLESSAFVF